MTRDFPPRRWLLTRLLQLGLGGCVVLLGCGRDDQVITAPPGRGSGAIDWSGLPVEFQAEARVLAAAAEASPATPLTDAEARQLLADNELGWRVGVLADRLGYRVLNALRATRDATGVAMTRGRVVIDADGRLAYDLGTPGDATLTVVGGATAPLEITFESASPALVDALGQTRGSIGFLAPPPPAGRLIVRLKAADRLDVRLTLEVPGTSAEGVGARVLRRVEGWIVVPEEGRLEVRALTVDDTFDSFHGSAIQEAVTAVVSSPARRALLSERHDRFGYFDPTSMTGGGHFLASGFHFTRFGAQTVALPDLELKRYFESRLYYQVVTAPESWRATGHFAVGGETVAELAFAAPPVAGHLDEPDLQLVRPGLTPVAAQPLPARLRLDALVPDPFPGSWPHGRAWRDAN